MANPNPTAADQQAEGKQNQSSRNSLEDIRSNLFHTGLIGVAVGLVGIIGYSLALKVDTWKLLFLSMIIGAAAYIAGFFLGFLFGIPKLSDNGDQQKSSYRLNNNLVDISDWLTKIIVGIGLVEMKKIILLLVAVGEYITKATKAESSLTVFSICLILYFSIFGLYYGYNYMRLYLSSQYKDSDDYLLRDQLTNQIVSDFNEKDSASDERIRAVASLSNAKSTEEQLRNMLNKAKEKMELGRKLVPLDPQNGQWGGLAEKNGRKLSATVSNLVGDAFFKIMLKVESTNAAQPLEDGQAVLFNVHPTFIIPHKISMVKNGVATLELISYGSFTVGVLMDNGDTELELDLATLPGVSEKFKTT